MHNETDHVPPAAKQMYALGSRTEAAIKSMYKTHQIALFTEEDATVVPIPTDDLESLSHALLQPRWSDAEAESLILGLSSSLGRDPKPDVSLVSRWVMAHHDDSGSVLLCMEVEPPNEIEIRRVLSRAGSQKLVFLGSWRLTQKDVVVKRLLDPGVTASRELEAFPLNLSHPNIIETFRLENRHQELFLVEELLPDVLHDGWRAQGVQEAANLLHDVGAAIKYLHDHDRVHGDIKPDNIGRRDGLFILLDFGICRPTAEFSRDSTATGSLRTRAPELFESATYIDPPKVDVWALGATIFAARVGRFPLIEPGETIPRISSPRDREAFEQELGRRAREEWEERVDLSLVDEELRDLLSVTLEPDPARRASSADLLDAINRSLPAYLHGGDARTLREGRFSPVEELDQIEAYVRDVAPRTILPVRVQMSLRDRLKQLEATQGFSATDQSRAAAAAAVLSRVAP